MNIAGFYQELWAPSYGTPAGSLRASLLLTPHEDAKKITGYLLAGHEIFNAMGSSEDVLDSGKTVLGGDSIFSDGEWIWRGDLWFYVWNYHVQLPEEFLTRVRGSTYSIPSEDDPRLVEIAKYVQANL